MKRAVYESITKNFDVFEFLDKDHLNNTLPNDGKGPKTTTNGGVEANLSDELEFEIDDQDVFLDSDQVLSGQQRNPQNRDDGDNAIIDDLIDDLSNASSGEPQQILKRGSTQATADGVKISRNPNSSLRNDSRYVSPFSSQRFNNQNDELNRSRRARFV